MFPNSYFILQSLPLLSDWIAEFKFLTFLVHVGPGAWPGGRGEPSRTPRPVTGRRSQGEHCSDKVTTHCQLCPANPELALTLAIHFPLYSTRVNPSHGDISDQGEWATCNRIPLLFSCSQLPSATLTHCPGRERAKQGWNCSQITPFTVSFYSCILMSARKFPL